MSIINHLQNLQDKEQEAMCPKCYKVFLYTTEDQVPGFRMKDELRCPHCGAVARTSMEVEFHSYPRPKKKKKRNKKVCHSGM